MMISNNSSLLKDSQELTKTKQTIWKPLIAVSLLSIFRGCPETSKFKHIPSLT